MCQKSNLSSFFSMSSLPKRTKLMLKNHTDEELKIAFREFMEDSITSYTMTEEEAMFLYNTPNPVGGMTLSKDEFLFFWDNDVVTQGMESLWVHLVLDFPEKAAKYLRLQVVKEPKFRTDPVIPVRGWGVKEEPINTWKKPAPSPKPKPEPRKAVWLTPRQLQEREQRWLEKRQERMQKRKTPKSIEDYGILRDESDDEDVWMRFIPDEEEDWE